MKWLLLIPALPALLLAVLAAAGAALPRGHTVTRAARFRRPATEVFATLRDFSRAPEWRSGLVRVEILPPRDGQCEYREIGRDGAILYRVEEERPPGRLVTRIADDKLPFGGSWTFAVLPAADGCEVRITEQGEIRNVFFRALARFVFGYASTMETYLRDLGRKFGETAVPGP